MEQYIPKDTLATYIDNILDYADEHWDTDYVIGAQKFADKLQDVICTIGAKEVDDDKSLNIKEVDFEKELIKWHKKHFKKDGTFIGMSGFYLTKNSQMDIAKHFFELGLAQKGEINGV